MSEKASRALVEPGMRLSQARAICSEIVWRDYDEHLYRKAQKELIADMVACSPRVSGSSVDPGMFLLDAGGRRLIGGESKLCRDLLRLVSTRGYIDGKVGIADSAFAATVAAANRRRRWLIVPRGEDRKFLAQLAIDYLPVSQETMQTLKSLGIRRIGQFVDLPVEQVRRRFGSEGEKAYDLALGNDDMQPALPVVEKKFQCVLDIGGPVESLNDTVFVIKSLLARLVQELEREGLCAEELTACFYNDSDLIEERPIRLIRPSNNSKFLLEILRLSIEAKPLTREFTALKLLVSRTANEAFSQLNMTGTKSADALIDLDTAFSTDSFLLMLQRIATRLGENSVVRPVARDQYFTELAGCWKSVAEKRELETIMPVETNPESMAVCSKRGLVAGMVLKRYDSAKPVLVQFQGQCPVSVSIDGTWYRIDKISAPECLSGLWWETPVRKSYYSALLRDERSVYLMVMLVYDHEKKGWFVEGVYD